MTQVIQIRLVKTAERQQLNELALRSKAYWGYSQDFMDACRSELTITEANIVDPKLTYVLAELNGQIVGYYALEHTSKTEYELEALFVEPKYIGQGVGRKLINHAKERARNAGAKSITIQGDPNAKKFYLAAGAILIGERESESVAGRYLPEFSIDLDS